MNYIMKMIIGFVLFFMIIGSLRYDCLQKEKDNVSFSSQNKEVLLAGHRGYSAYYPENTMLAFKNAIAEGARGIELDVHVTIDGNVVVSHDDYVDRVTDGTGVISEISWDYISSLDAGSWKDEKFADERMVRLDEVLDEFQGQNVFILIELKVNAAEMVVQLIEERNMENQSIVRSFSLDYINRAKHLAPHIRTQYIYYKEVEWKKAYSDALENGHEITLRYNQINKYKMSYARQKDLIVYASTVNDIDDIRCVINLGVDGVIGDYVDRLMKVKREKNITQPDVII
jgi:glycerophosphoryl diester phosphodiesterase